MNMFFPYLVYLRYRGLALVALRDVIIITALANLLQFGIGSAMEVESQTCQALEQTTLGLILCSFLP